MGQARRRKLAAAARGETPQPAGWRVPSFYLPADVGLRLQALHNQACLDAASAKMPAPTPGQVLVAWLRQTLPATPTGPRRLIVTPEEALARPPQ